MKEIVTSPFGGKLVCLLWRGTVLGIPKRVVLLLLGGLVLCASSTYSNEQGVPAGQSVKIAMGQRSWRVDGLVCYRSGEGEGTRIHLVKITAENVQPIFVKEVGRGARAPFFCGDSIILVKQDGSICKFDLNGGEIFAERPAGFTGLVMLSGPVSEKCLYMVETVADEKNRKISHYLCLVRIDGRSPRVEKRFKLREPGKIDVDSSNGRIWVRGWRKWYKFGIPTSCLE